MIRIRISSHRLAIDRGRYTTPVTPAEDRKCKMCNSQAIKDETHLMLSCEYYKSLRDQFIKLNSKHHNFAFMTYVNKLIYIMSSGTKMFPLAVAYLCNAWKREGGGTGHLQIMSWCFLNTFIFWMFVLYYPTPDITIVYASKV